MRFPVRPLSYLILCAMLTACGGGGGDDTLLTNPPTDNSGDNGGDNSGGDNGDDGDGGTVDPTPDDDGIVKSNDGDTFSVKNQFIGFYIESPDYDRDDFSVGHIFMQHLTSPGALEGGEPGEAIVSYKYKDCQDRNTITLAGRYNDKDSTYEIGYGTGAVDQTSQVFFTDVGFNEELSAWTGPYDINGSDYVSVDGCINHQLGARGKVEVFPLNTTFYTDGSADYVVEFDSSNPRSIKWNYANFSAEATNLEHITVSIFDKSKVDSLNLFGDIYSLQNQLLLAADDEKDALEDQLNTAILTYSPRMTNDLFVWQEIIPGDANSFTLPDSVSLVKDNYYILSITAWSSEDLSNKVYYSSNHVFRAD